MRLWAEAPAVCDEPGRIELSRGTCFARDVEPPERPYIDHARLPRDPWREPDDQERESLWTSVPQPMNRTIAILRVFERRDLSRFADIIAAIKPRRSEVLDFHGDPMLSWLLQRSRSLRARGPFNIHALAVNEPGRRALAIDNGLKQHVGLHIDVWEASDFASLRSARNRIAINVGTEPRFLVFMNIPVAEMIPLVGARAPLGGAAEVHSVMETALDAFLAAFPDYPAVRLRIDPGEAYVAPTESIAHDGSTAGTTTPDRVLMLRGHFSLRVPSLLQRGAMRLGDIVGGGP